jgi:nitroreductase
MIQTNVENAAATPEALLTSLRWRYATKKFDPAKKIPQKTWDALEQALVLAPSSYGLQPWKFFVVENAELRAKLKPASWGQGQIVDADKLVVFAVRKDFGPADVDKFVAHTAAVRGVPAASLEQYRQMMLGSVNGKSPEARLAWGSKQVYIALGLFLSAAAALGVDACPMEGIDPAKYDEILGLGAKGYTALVVATAGYRAADDAYSQAKKVRFDRAQVVERL